MDEAVCKLFAWLSPAYPVGAFTYSHGLEWAVKAGDVRDFETLTAWIADVLQHGAGRTDAVLLACACRAACEGDTATLAKVAELAEALAPSAERLLETASLGAAFAKVTAAAWSADLRPAAYPVALGWAVAQHRIPLDHAVPLYLLSFAGNLVSVGVRLGVAGQTDAQRALASLMPLCAAVAAEAITLTIDDIGGSALRSDIASMRHETQETRLFRS